MALGRRHRHQSQQRRCDRACRESVRSSPLASTGHCGTLSRIEISCGANGREMGAEADWASRISAEAKARSGPQEPLTMSKDDDLPSDLVWHEFDRDDAPTVFTSISEECQREEC